MLGSSDSVAEPNVVLNTAAAEALCQFADELEGAEDFETALHDLIQKTIRRHKRIIWGGNCYDESWEVEAEKRGLLNLKTTPDALARLLDEKNVTLFAKHKIYTETELHSRLEILLENYCKIVNIEARTMVDMARKEILPAVSEYVTTLGDAVAAGNILEEDMRESFEMLTAKELIALKAKAFEKIKELEKDIKTALAIEHTAERALYYKSEVLSVMADLRCAVDKLETLTAEEFWPMPTYGDLLFGVI